MKPGFDYGNLACWIVAGLIMALAAAKFVLVVTS